MAKTFSSLDEVGRLPDSPVKEILLDDLKQKPLDCREFRDILECADTTAVLVEPGDDIHSLREDEGHHVDLTDFDRMHYEDIALKADGRMVVAAEIGTWYYIPVELLSPDELALFRQRAKEVQLSFPITEEQRP